MRRLQSTLFAIPIKHVWRVDPLVRTLHERILLQTGVLPDPINLNLPLMVVISIQTIQPLTYNKLAMSWAESLVQLHYPETPMEAQEAFQEYERDIIDMIGHQSYCRFLEQYTTLLHTTLGNKASCSVKTCPSTINSVGKPSVRMVSL